MYGESVTTQGLWVYARDHSIQRIQNNCLCSMDSLIHGREIMIYTKVHEWVNDMSLGNRKMVLSLDDHLKYHR